MKFKILASILFSSLLSFAATIDLKAAGAKGDGNADDTAAIRNAINGSASGDSIQCPSGTYRVTSQLTFTSNRTYRGLSGCKLTGSIGQQLVTLANGAANVTVDGWTFDGGGLSLGPGLANNITVTHNTFQNIIIPGGNGISGVLATGGANNSSISGNTFTNIWDSRNVNGWSDQCGAIWVWDSNSITISGNTFSSICQAVHYTANKNLSNVTVNGNAIHRNARFGIEIQGNFAITNVDVSGNTFDDPQPINGPIGISLAVGGTGHTVTNNTLYGPNLANPNFQSAAMEVMGAGFLIQGNIAGNWEGAQLIGWSDNTWKTLNNTWCGMTDRNGGQVISIEGGGMLPGTNAGNTNSVSCNGNTPTPPTSVTPPPTGSACDLNNDGVVSVLDVQLAVNMSLGSIPCTANINGSNVCAVTTIQRVVNAALGGACVTGT